MTATSCLSGALMHAEAGMLRHTIDAICCRMALPLWLEPYCMVAPGHGQTFKTSAPSSMIVLQVSDQPLTGEKARQLYESAAAVRSGGKCLATGCRLDTSRSQTSTAPAQVMQANMVALWGDHATSITSSVAVWKVSSAASCMYGRLADGRLCRAGVAA